MMSKQRTYITIDLKSFYGNSGVYYNKIENESSELRV